MKIDCKIIEDLVPLYLDEVCSEESRKAVDTHIEKCENCRKLVKGNTEVELPYIEPAELVKEKAVKKGFRKIRLKIYLAILATCVLVSGMFLLEKWCQKQIELEKTRRTQQCQRKGHADCTGIGKAQTVQIDPSIQGIARCQLLGNGLGDQHHRSPQERTRQHQLTVLADIAQLKFGHIIINEQSGDHDHSDQTGNTGAGAFRQNVQPIQSEAQHHEHQNPGHLT